MKTAFFFYALLVLTACSRQQTKQPATNSAGTTLLTGNANPEEQTAENGLSPAIDTSRIAIVPYDSTKNASPLKGRPALLTSSELALIDTLVKQAVDVYNQKAKPRFRITYPGTYKRQYVAVTNGKGEKEVWVNLFCSTPGINWKHSIVGVDDGGACYFNLILHLPQKACLKFEVNGVG